MHLGDFVLVVIRVVVLLFVCVRLSYFATFEKLSLSSYFFYLGKMAHRLNLQYWLPARATSYGYIKDFCPCSAEINNEGVLC